MYTKACYLNGKFASQKLALNMSNILALAGFRCHQHPCQQVRSQLRTEVRARNHIGVIKHCEQSQPEQALNMSHCDGLWAWVHAWWAVRSIEQVVSGQSVLISLYFPCVFHKPSPITKDIMWSYQGQWTIGVMKLNPRLRKNRFFILPQIIFDFLYTNTLILHFKLLYLNFDIFFFTFLVL